MGFPIDDSQFRRHLPQDLRYIAFYRKWGEAPQFTLDRLGGPWQIRTVETLPDWTVYARE
jgi:hypothetical protein